MGLSLRLSINVHSPTSLKMQLENKFPFPLQERGKHMNIPISTNTYPVITDSADWISTSPTTSAMLENTASHYPIMHSQATDNQGSSSTSLEENPGIFVGKNHHHQRNVSEPGSGNVVSWGLGSFPEDSSVAPGGGGDQSGFSSPSTNWERRPVYTNFEPVMVRVERHTFSWRFEFVPET